MYGIFPETSIFCGAEDDRSSSFRTYRLPWNYRRNRRFSVFPSFFSPRTVLACASLTSVLLRVAVAGGKMPRLVLLVYGCNVTADLHRFGTARMELTALGRICGRRNIAVQHDSVHLDVGIRGWEPPRTTPAYRDARGYRKYSFYRRIPPSIRDT